MDDRVKVVSIMNYPPEPKLRRMCCMFLDSVIANGAQSITLLYEDCPPVVLPQQRRLADIEIRKARSVDVGHPHFNLRYKLANLAALDYPYLYLDADTVVLSDLRPAWSLRRDKPWIGIDHQWIPADPRTHRPPFLNSGLQLVSDPAFYDLAAILAVQNEVAPLSRHAELRKDQLFACPGTDQAVLYRYFQKIGYDYRHPGLGPAWNSCAGVTRVERMERRWTAQTIGLPANHDVHIIHYWGQFKPWLIHCPIFDSYAWADAPLAAAPS